MKNRHLHLLTLFFLFFTFFFLAAHPTHALVRRKIPTQTSSPVVNRGTVGIVGIVGRLRSDRRAIILSVTGLNSAESITYLLTYVGNGQSQGAQGIIRPIEGAVASRELLFGTCSHGVCTYHIGIKDARLEVTAKLKNGKILIKRYKIKM